jgi:hypothetical protein
VSHVSAGIINAGPTVIDDFESQLYEDEGKSLSDYYGGDLSDFQRQQSTVEGGDYALEPTAGTSAILDDGGDFPLTTDTTWEFHQYHTSGSADGGWMWMAQNESGRGSRDGYLVKIRSNNSDMTMNIVENGNESNLAITGITVPTDEWMRGVVEHLSDGSITFTVFDSNSNQLGQLSATDTTHSSGGHGFSCYNAGLVFDSVRETSQ